MKMYDIFASEGGYRVCGGLWGDDPIINQCPWFTTREEAEIGARKMKEEDNERTANEIAFDPVRQSFAPPELVRRAKEIEKEVENRVANN